MGARPLPKPDAERRRRNAPTFERVVLPAEGRPGPAPELPDVRPWLPLTRQWWAQQWSTPMATQWREDEPSMHRLALLTDLLWSGEVGPAVATEMRQLEAGLGMSPKARRDLRWSIEGETPGATVTPLRTVPDAAAKRRAALRKKV